MKTKNNRHITKNHKRIIQKPDRASNTIHHLRKHHEHFSRPKKKNPKERPTHSARSGTHKFISIKLQTR